MSAPMRAPMRALSYVRKPDVCIIGSGIIGNAISLNLARLGYKVNVYDSNPGPGYGTTSYSSGICRNYYSSLESIKLSWESFQYWKNWRNYIDFKDHNGFAKLEKSGVLFLKSNNSRDFLKKSCDLMKQVDIPFNFFDFSNTDNIVKKMGLDIYNTYPTVNIDDALFGSTDHKNYIDGGVYFPEAGFVGNPQLAAINLYHSSKNLGTRFMYNTKICKINVKNNKIIGMTTTSNEKIDSPIVINCGGPYSTKINNMAFKKNDIYNDMKINCRPLRKEVAYTQLSDEYNIKQNGTTVIDLDLGLYYRPETGNKLLIGSTEPKCDKSVWEDELDFMDENTTELWQNQMYRAALRIPDLKIPNSKNQQFVVSTYDVSDDWTPIYDKSSIEGYYMAIGTSGNQFKNAPVVGLMMAGLIDACENGLNHDKIPFKYRLKKTKGGTINVGSFSRLRTPNQNKSNVFG